MKSKNQTLKFKLSVDAPVHEVYSAFTNATALCEWLCDGAHLDPLPGKRLYLCWNSGYYACGEYLERKPAERVVFSWQGRGEPGMTRIRVTLKASDGGTVLSLAHLDCGSGKAWDRVRKQFKDSWSRSLENLKSVLDTGIDLRQASRPILGVSGLEVVTPEVAVALGLPVESGLRLQSVVAGLGAQAAGLLNDDVLVQIDGQKVASIPDLFSVMQAHDAGDKVKVVFYRGAERMKARMELSARPFAEVPETAEGLAEALNKVYGEGNALLSQVLEGASTAEGSFQPEPTAWSVNDVLAHLIACERETHTWIAGVIESQESNFAYHANLPTRVKAIVTAIPTTKALFDEFKLNQQETIAMLRALPPEFVARKRSYVRMGRELLTFSLHYQDHIEQIRTALNAARGRSALEAQAVAPAEVIQQPDVLDQS